MLDRVERDVLRHGARFLLHEDASTAFPLVQDDFFRRYEVNPLVVHHSVGLEAANGFSSRPALDALIDEYRGHAEHAALARRMFARELRVARFLCRSPSESGRGVRLVEDG